MRSVSNTRRLRALLNGAKDQQGLTLAQVVHRSEGRLRKSRVGNLLNDQYRSDPLGRDDLEVIAEAFRVNYDSLRIAHLMDMGLLEEGETDVPAIALELPPGTDSLTIKQRSAVLAVIRAMLDPLDDLTRASRSPHPVDVQNARREAAESAGVDDTDSPRSRQR